MLYLDLDRKFLSIFIIMAKDDIRQTFQYWKWDNRRLMSIKKVISPCTRFIDAANVLANSTTFGPSL